MSSTDAASLPPTPVVNKDAVFTNILRALRHRNYRPALREIVRPICVVKGILPQVADGLNVADELASVGDV